MEELEKNKKLAEQEISGKELYDLRKGEKEKEKKKEVRKEKLHQAPKKIGRLISYAAGGVIILGGLAWFLSSSPNLPPTSMQNHSENSPPSHILTQPIPGAIQRHMLEHADGKTIPGIIIQYNCNDFDCEPELVQNLTALVEKYPNNVYLAPNNYDGKIIITKLGRREIMDSFDEQAIKTFINK